jgi:hemerythrin
VLEDLIVCLETHFDFEENFHQQTHYQLSDSHKETHDVFLSRIKKYKERFAAGEDVAEKLHRILTKWIEHHIQYDMDYAATIKHLPPSVIAQTISVENANAKVGFVRLFTQFAKAIAKNKRIINVLRHILVKIL